MHDGLRRLRGRGRLSADECNDDRRVTHSGRWSPDGHGSRSIGCGIAERPSGKLVDVTSDPLETKLSTAIQHRFPPLFAHCQVFGVRAVPLSEWLLDACWPTMQSHSSYPDQ